MGESPKDADYEELLKHTRNTEQYKIDYASALTGAILDARMAKEKVDHFTPEEVEEVLGLSDQKAFEGYCRKHGVAIDFDAVRKNFEENYSETLVKRDEASKRFLKKLHEIDPKNPDNQP